MPESVPGRPKVGVGLLLLKGNQILLGRRRGAIRGADEYSGAGGHLELGESFEDAIRRELAEEAGPALHITNLHFLCVTNLTRYAPKHYIDIGMSADWEAGEPVVMEPHKLESWGWYDLSDLPGPRFAACDHYLVAHETGQTYFTN
jgi:8-oxo-dGTP diphosphatase